MASEKPESQSPQLEALNIPIFTANIQKPSYDDYLDLKNYSNVSYKDKYQYFKYKHLNDSPPLFIKKNLAKLNRRIFVQTPLPDDMIVQDGENSFPRYNYPRNKIRTTKYTPINFIPKNLFFQFQNVANGYFLFVAILGAFQIFGVSSPALNAVPLIVIVFLTAVRDAFEDSRRGLSDNELNNSRIHLITGLENPNVVIDHVGVWRRFKKANSRFFNKLLFEHIIPMFKKNKNKKSKTGDYEEGMGHDLTSQLSQTETLNTVQSNNTRFTANNRLSIQTTRVLNARNKVSRPIPDTATDPLKPPSGTVKFRNKAWKDIYVGDIVRVRQNEEVPADMILLSSSLEDQNCYIETKNLDGETNLKSKTAVRAGAGLKYGNDVERLKFWIECDSPNPNLYAFKGAMHYPDFAHPEKGENVESLNINNILFRGSTLRNTKWVIGVVAYTGSETKIMLNSGVTPTKRSRISRELNLSVYINFILLFVLAFVAGVVNGVFYNKKHVSRLYYEFEPYTDKSSVSGVVAFFVAVILYQALVPISLYISVEIIKTVQAFFIYSDVKMYYERLDYPCVPKSWNISDDVGQVEFIFSDKTGTLTQNVMEFKKCSVGMYSYGQCYTEAKMGMQKRLGVDVVKEKIRMDKVVADDKALMLKLIGDNADFFNNHVDTNYISHLNPDELTFISADYIKAVLDAKDPQKPLNEWFMTALGLCHTAVIEEDPENEHKKLIKAESPDENALVGAARDVGIEYKGKTRDHMYLSKYGIESEYKVLNVLPFDSTRKRMSIIVEVSKNELPEYAYTNDDEKVIVLLSKGADNIIFQRLKSNSDEQTLQKTALYLEQFSKEGLRTLCVAYKVLDSNSYYKWAERYHLANSSVDDDREEQIELVANEIEQDLTLIGSTAIEDRLQDGVPDSIALLSQAGIKLWVLTGDKIETAINIGFSCNLLGSEMKLLVVGTGDDTPQNDGEEVNSDNNNVSSNTYFDMREFTDYEKVDAKVSQFLAEEFNINLRTDDDIEDAILQAQQNHDTPEGTHAIIVDGAALTIIFDELNLALQKKFLLLCKNCKSVLCCRVSPAQKAQVVRIVKDNLKVMTLAIGDGANDVAMIQAANIGVGIAGEEGRQAVMSSDYGLGQFRFLTRLVLVHGRWSYKRLAEMIPCFFYKNVVFTVTLFWYGIYVDFDGTYLFEFTLIMFYNLAFTSLPIIFLAVLDQDVSDTVSLLVPELYRSGILGLEWSQYKFVFYMLDGLYQSVLSFFLPYLLYFRGGFVHSNGLTLNHRFWMGTMVATVAAVSCNVYVLLQQKRWDWLSGIIYAFSILVVFFWIGIWSASTYSGEYYKAAAQVYGNLTFWCVFFVGVLFNVLPRFTFDTVRRLYKPKDVDIIRERVAMGDFDKYSDGYDPTDANDVAKYRVLSDNLNATGVATTTDPTSIDTSSSDYNKNGSIFGNDPESKERVNKNLANEGVANSTQLNDIPFSKTDEELLPAGNDTERFPAPHLTGIKENEAINTTAIPQTIERRPTVKDVFKHPIGSIRRRMTISKSKKAAQNSHLSPLEQMRANMIRSGEYTGSRTSLSTQELPGLSQAESLMSVHSRRTNR